MRRSNDIVNSHRLSMIAAAFAGIVMMSSSAHASPSGFEYSLDISGDRGMTLSARDVPLGALFEDIQEQTGLKLSIHRDHLNRTVTVAFRSLPLEQAIDRILDGINYVYRLPSDNRRAELITMANPLGISHPRDIAVERESPLVMDEPVPVPPELEDMEVAMGIEPPSEMEDLEDAMRITPAPPAEDMETTMMIVPPPDNLPVEEVMQIERPIE